MCRVPNRYKAYNKPKIILPFIKCIDHYINTDINLFINNICILFYFFLQLCGCLLSSVNIDANLGI